jgi:hypothetical protein
MYNQIFHYRVRLSAEGLKELLDKDRKFRPDGQTEGHPDPSIYQIYNTSRYLAGGARVCIRKETDSSCFLAINGVSPRDEKRACRRIKRKKVKGKKISLERL